MSDVEREGFSPVYVLPRRGSGVSKAVWPQHRMTFPNKEAIAPETTLPAPFHPLNKNRERSFFASSITTKYPEIVLLSVGFLMSLALYFQLWYIAIPLALSFICIVLFVSRHFYLRTNTIMHGRDNIDNVELPSISAFPRIPDTVIPQEQKDIRALDTINLGESNIPHFIEDAVQSEKITVKLPIAKIIEE